MKRLLEIIGLAAIAVLLMGGAHGLHGGWKNNAPGKVYRPDKEEVAVGGLADGAMRDSCVPSSPFHLLTDRPAVC